MNENTITCPVCGGKMMMVKVIVRGLYRYKCTCGHSEETTCEDSSPPREPQELPIDVFHDRR